MAGQRRFVFTTGGPAVIRTLPWEGAQVEEEQIFVLGLDAPARRDTLLRHAYCTAEGTRERIPVQLVEGAARQRVLEAGRGELGGLLHVILKSRERTASATLGLAEKGTPFEQALKTHGDQIVTLRCARRLPPKAEVHLVWGAGIATTSGVAGTEDQTLAFQVREPFRARFSCEKVNKDAQCVPILPMSLYFSAPVSRKAAERIVLAGGGRTWKAKVTEEGDAVSGVSFTGPFPEKTRFALRLPADLRDDSGRPLANRKSFPLTVRTDEEPPLAKFPARFGIIELNAGATLPVTVRNIEAELDLGRAKAAAPVPGKTLRAAQEPGDILRWLARVGSYEGQEAARRSVFGPGDKVARFTLPNPGGAKAFEVIGIPLEKPGLYVVELASPRLGAALFGEKAPYHVQTAALVTDLAVHFKQGRESSLVWVTALDSGQPVAEAEVSVRDCGGKVHWQGRTGSDGLARIPRALPSRDSLPACYNHQNSYFVTARKGDDLSFVFSHWNEGIANWRFNVPGPGYQGPWLAHTVFDRTLLRAGETVHMKHFFRQHTGAGFRLPDPATLPGKMVIVHVGSDQKYELPLKWRGDGSAEAAWTVPQDAKQGTYTVQLPGGPAAKEKRFYEPERTSGSFRVEAFRVPTMRAVLKPVDTPLVDAAEAQLDIQLNYLSGGGAGFQPVKLRAVAEDRYVNFPDYEGFTFAAGAVKEGLQDERAAPWAVDDYAVEDDGEAAPAEGPGGNRPFALQSLTLDAAGAARAILKPLPKGDKPRSVLAELEYRDPNGETLTAASGFTLWPSRVLLGVAPDSWALNRDALRFKVVALGLDGKPLPDVAVTVDLLQRADYSHRKRTVGGFYAYEHRSEIKRLGELCAGRTDARGYLFCEGKSPVSGSVILQARAADGEGHASVTHTDLWVAGQDDWWFQAGNDDRMDVLPEKKRLEPGETARLQVRMPFREATALVTVEREGVLDAFVTPLSGKGPVVELPIRENYAPNVYASVLAVRGRVGDVQPTALIDLGKPAFKLGLTALNVGWKGHELRVSVTPQKTEYPVRGTVRTRIKVTRADGGPLPPNAQVALAAVDEGLLELMPNESWKLLEAMMRPRGLEVETATAQMQVVGKRHYGRKALPSGGGGGRQSSRELFDTLLKWQARVGLDDDGEADVFIPLNDTLGAFRIVAVASAGAGHFGTGSASVRTTQDVMLFSGLPPLVREGDEYRAAVTVRNAGKTPLALTLSATLTPSGGQARALSAQPLTLAPGEAREAAWNVTAPAGSDTLTWDIAAQTAESMSGDRLKVSQKVVPAVPVRTYQATLTQLDRPLALPVERPADALPGRGSVVLHFRDRLADELAGVQDYMRRYPYTCLEQQVSRAVALRDRALWDKTMAALPAYLDGDGLAKYFPLMRQGSDTLTAYLLALAGESGWPVPDALRERMNEGLTGFVQGRVVRAGALPTADLAIRKVAALDALSRFRPVDDALTQSFAVEPNLWPTSAVLDWHGVLRRSPTLAQREVRLRQAEQVLRARLNVQGTTLGFSTERSDFLWWLMVSGDVNANRAILALLDSPGWKEDIPRLVRGALGRQHKGRWNTTVANAWGTLAMEKFSARFESVPVTGMATARLGAAPPRTLAWDKTRGGDLAFPWPKDKATLAVAQEGTGKPWVTVESRAALPLKHALSSGFKATRTVTPLEQKVKGRWSRGDLARVRLDLEAQSDMTWVVVDDPVPAGASVLGTGLGRDSRLATRGEKRVGWVWPAFEERTFEGFRAYYEFVPKGRWTVEYTVRLNNPGRFALPPTRVEAMYAPEMFGEYPNRAVTVEE